MPDFSIFVGVDVSKNWLDVHVLLPGDGGDALAFRVTNDKPGWKSLLTQLGLRSDARTTVALGAEASGGYEKPMLDYLAGRGLAAFCLDPAAVRAYARAMGRRAKTDPIDAAMIAGLLSARAASLVPHLPRPDLDRLAQMIAYRDRLVAERTRLADDQPDEPLVQRLMRTRLASLKAGILQLDKAIAERLRTSPDLAELAQRLLQVPGVGKTLCATLIARLPELGTIGPKPIAALVGLAPFDRQSGNRTLKAHCNGGRAQIRKTLYMATLAAVRGANSPLTTFYQRLRDAGTPFKQAIVAAMRKFLTILNAIVRDSSSWRAA